MSSPDHDREQGVNGSHSLLKKRVSLLITSQASLDPAEAPRPAEHRSDIKQFLTAWAWKREHRPDRQVSTNLEWWYIAFSVNPAACRVMTLLAACMRRARFKKPYTHKLCVGDDDEEVCLTIKQAKFVAEGFASTGMSHCPHAPSCCASACFCCMHVQRGRQHTTVSMQCGTRPSCWRSMPRGGLRASRASAAWT